MPPLEDSEAARFAALQEFSAFHATSDAWAMQMQRYFARMPRREVSPSFASSRSDNLSDADWMSCASEPYLEQCRVEESQWRRAMASELDQWLSGGEDEGQHEEEEEEEEEEEATGEAIDGPEQRSPPATIPKKRPGLRFF